MPAVINSYRVWIKDELGGFSFTAEISSEDATAVVMTFKTFMCGRSIIIL